MAFCVQDVNINSITEDAYEYGTTCFAEKGKWVSSWTRFISPTCDSWFKRIDPVDETTISYVRVNPLLFNTTCNIPDTQWDRYISRKARADNPCVPPYNLGLTKYLQFSFYKVKMTDSKDILNDQEIKINQFFFQYFVKCWADVDPKNPKVLTIHMCPSESVDYDFASVGNISDGVPGITDTKNLPKSGVFMTFMRHGSDKPEIFASVDPPNDHQIVPARMDYVDIHSPNLDEPKIWNAVPKWTYAIIAAGLVMVFSFIGYRIHRLKKRV